MIFLIDLGKVLFDFDFEASLSRFLPENVPSVSEWIAPVMEKKDPYEAGRIATDEYIPWAMQRLGVVASEADFRRAWCEIFRKNEPMWDDLAWLKREGHRLILFSNINDLHWDFIREKWPEVEAMFEERVLSYEAGAIKPEREIYEYALKRFGLEATSLRYVDDLEKNLAGGERLGMRVFRYDLRQHGDFQAWLERELREG